MKRYPKYKDSGIQWLGQIPEHWEIKRLASLFTNDIASNSDFAYRHAFKFNYGTLVPKNEFGEESEYRDTYIKYSVLQKNDIVLNGLNLNYDFISQRVAIAPNDGIITSAYIVARPRPTTFADYYLHVLKTMDNMKLFHGMGTGIRLTLSFGELKKQMIPYPPVAEQEKIVSFINTKTNQIDGFISEREKQLQALTELRQTIISEVVTRGLNPDAPLKDSGVAFIGLIPAHWSVEPFGRHFTYSKGLPITKADLRPEGVAVISYGQVHSKQNSGLSMSENLVRRVSKDYLQTHPQCLLQASDFVFADTSEDIEGAGNFAYNDYADSIFAGYHTLVARPIDLPYPKYYACLFRSSQWKSQVGSLVNGVKVFSITRGILKKSYILMPPIEEQRAIVEYIDTKCKHINDTIAQIESEITHLKEYKQRLIADAVTGAINVQE